MVYSDKFCVVLESNGKLIREANSSKNGEIILPFGTDYSIVLKNLESRKAVVKVSIDGTDVLNGQTLLMNGNETLTLEGFLIDNVVKNKFRFIEKTQEVSDFRGDRVDDGLIRVEFQFEKEQPEIKKVITEHIDHYYWDGWRNKPWNNRRCGEDIVYGSGTCNSSNSVMRAIKGIESQNFAAPPPTASSSVNNNDKMMNAFNDNGITVEGAQTNQQFKYAQVGELETNTHTIVIRLRGTISNPQTGETKDVNKPRLVRQQMRCKSCGRMAKSNTKFCPNCGTFLT